MKVTELRALEQPALQKELQALLREQFNLRMQKGSGQAVKAHVRTRVRREIARVKTILREKELS